MKKIFAYVREARCLGVTLCLVAMWLAVGCASVPLKIPTPKLDQKYEVIGKGTGNATGLMVFQVIPIGQNERFDRAYYNAVRSQNGDDLINPVIEERWFWAYILNGYSTTVSGDVIKYIK